MELLENANFYFQVTSYLRRMLDIKYVNMERLAADPSRNVPDGAAYVFGDVFRFIVKELPNDTYVFSPDRY